MANLSDNDRQKIVYEVAKAYAEAVDLESRLWLEGDKAYANSAELKANALYGELSKLKANLWGDWTSDAAAATKAIDDAADAVDTSINEVKGDIKNAQKVVRALGYLDQLIALAAKFAVA